MSTERPAELDVSVLPPEHRPAVIFAHTLFTSTPRVWVTYALVAACMGVFLAMAVRGVSILQPQVNDLIAWGANYPPRTGRGEWWRLITCLFVHVGILHAAINMWVLWDVGPIVERLFGNVGFFLLYIFSGVWGSLASYVFSGGVTSAGASGGLFGLIGGLLAFTVGQKDAIPPHILRGIRKSVVICALINGAITFMIPNIDIAGHAGGFVGGIVCGLLLRQRFLPGIARTRWKRNLICAVVMPAAFLVIWQVLPPPPGDIIGEAPLLEASERQALTAFHDVVDKLRREKMTLDEAADAIERGSLIPIQEARKRLNAINRWPVGRGPPLHAWKEYFRLFEEAMQLHIQGLRKNDEQLIRSGQKRLKESEAAFNGF